MDVARLAVPHPFPGRSRGPDHMARAAKPPDGAGGCASWRNRRPSLWKLLNPVDPSSPPARTEIFAYSDRVIPAPGPVVSEIGGTEIAISGAEAIEQEMLGDAKFESLA